MTTKTIIDNLADKSGARSPRPNPQADMAAHIVVVTAMTLAIAKIVAVNCDDPEMENFLANFQQQCDKMGDQYSPAVLALAQKTCADITMQLRDVHRGHR